MQEDWRWLIGLAVTLSLGWGSILIGAFWRLLGMIRRVEDDMGRNEKELHGRINRIREDTVLKSDLDRHVAQMSEEVRALRTELRNSSQEHTNRLDALLAALAHHK